MERAVLHGGVSRPIPAKQHDVESLPRERSEIHDVPAVTEALAGYHSCGRVHSDEVGVHPENIPPMCFKQGNILWPLTRGRRQAMGPIGGLDTYYSLPGVATPEDTAPEVTGAHIE